MIRGDLGFLFGQIMPPPHRALALAIPRLFILLFTVVMLLWELLLRDTVFLIQEEPAYLFSSDVGYGRLWLSIRGVVSSF